jgi:hypothetical protein
MHSSHHIDIRRQSTNLCRAFLISRQ